MLVWCCAVLDLDELVHEMETDSSLALKLIHSVSTMNNRQSDCSDCSDEEEQDTTGTATFEPERQRDHIIPFPLFHLPSELADYIIDCADDRPQYPDVFPRGPSSDLLQFSLVSTYVHDRLRPAIWRSVRYIPQEGHRTRAYRKKRSLNALVILVEASERGRAGVVPIGSLSITAPGLRAADLNTAMTESGAIPDLIRLLTKMRVLLLDTCDFLPLMSDHVLTNILQHPSLTSLRLNQCTLNGKLSDLKTFEPMPRLKTLQIMHSSSSLVGTSSWRDVQGLTKGLSSSQSLSWHPTSSRSFSGQRCES